MSFGKFVNQLSDTINSGIRAIADSGIIGDAVGKATKVGSKIGSTAIDAGIKVGTTGIAKGADSLSFMIDNADDIKTGIKAFGKAVGTEAGEWANAGLGAIGKFSDTFTTSAPLDVSLIGRKFNKKGVALIAAGATVMKGGRDVKQYVDSRQGQNDGQLYSSTPRMSTPYMLSEQMAYSQHGRSFADNAGATGDLVFALNNMRNG